MASHYKSRGFTVFEKYVFGVQGGRLSYTPFKDSDETLRGESKIDLREWYQQRVEEGDG